MQKFTKCNDAGLPNKDIRKAWKRGNILLRNSFLELKGYGLVKSPVYARVAFEFRSARRHNGKKGTNTDIIYLIYMPVI